MRSSDWPGAAFILAPSMAWSQSMVESTFGLGTPVVSEVLTDGSQIVGVVHLVSDMPGVPDDLLMLRLGVANGWRRQGVGRSLWERVLDNLPRQATVVCRASADDEYSLGVGHHWGFDPVNTTLFQRRELPPSLIETGLSEPNVKLDVLRGRLVGSLHSRVRAAMVAGGVPDVPLVSYADSDTPGTADPAEPTMSIIAAQPGEVVAIFAVDRHVDVGFTIAFADGPGWHIADTAVIPSWRRRGVATRVKAELTCLAILEGVPWITTHNDAANGPILALNGASGFTPLAHSVSMRRSPGCWSPA